MLETTLAALRQLLLFAAVLTPLEVLWPAVRGQRLLRRGLLTDLGWALLAPMSAGALAAGVVMALHSVWTSLAPSALTQPLAGLPFGVKLALVLLFGELGGYLYHRAAHANPWLWRLHAVHHSPAELDWVSAHRQHTLEAAALLIIANVPAAMLGVAPSSALLVVVLQRLHTALVHANLALPEGRWERLIAGPRFHRWHHERDGAPANFASLLPMLDRLFGTYRLPAGQPASLGFAPVPEGLLRQALYPFSPGSSASQAHHPGGPQLG